MKSRLSLESSWLGHTPDPENFSCMILGDRSGVSWPSGQVCTADNGTLIDAVIQPLRMPAESHQAKIHAFYEAIVDHKPSPALDHLNAPCRAWESSRTGGHTNAHQCQSGPRNHPR